jgi:uncharacterized protein YdaU (DUF1376 family)
MRLEK